MAVVDEGDCDTNEDLEVVLVAGERGEGVSQLVPKAFEAVIRVPDVF
jgi:hypothetical protein